MLTIAGPERRLALAYVPPARRPALAALWALDEQLARIVATTREPAIGQMRLVWWRDALERLDTAPPPAEPILRALADHVLPAGVTGADMAAMTEGWDALLPVDAIDEGARARHAAERGERLFALSGRILGGQPPAGAGTHWALADIARLLPGTGRGTADAGGGGGGVPHSESSAALPFHQPRAGEERGYRWPRPLRPLGMLAILARRDSTERQGSPARLFAMLRHRLTGR